MTKELDKIDKIDLNSEQKVWIVKAVTGAIFADGVLQKEERYRFKALLNWIGEDEKLDQLAWETIRLKSVPTPEKINISSEISNIIFSIVIDICACDMTLHPMELNYLRKLGASINLPEEKINRLIKSADLKVKFEYFAEILKSLSDDHKLWLATVTTKLIYADDKIDPTEFFYLGHIYDLLEDKPEFIRDLKNNIKNINLAHLPIVSFSIELSKLIFRYLIEITIRNGILEQEGLTIAKKAANIMNLDEEYIKEVISSTEKIYLTS